MSTGAAAPRRPGRRLPASRRDHPNHRRHRLEVRTNTADERSAAQLVVCGRATDVDDARELLDMLGLLDGAR